ncbi:MAG: 4Fe-4S dicluster domain-containing protein [Candidatus Korobacteraceae bacterium]
MGTPVGQPDPVPSLLQNKVGSQLASCYQCGKCTAGCPRAAPMDAPPTRLLRWLQLGEEDRALAAQSIWDCVACQTCSARCPQSVDCAYILDVLRQEAIAQDTVAPARRRIVAFQQAFLDNIRRNGRLNELELTASFKLRAFRHDHAIEPLFQDASLAPQLRKRGKLHLKAERVRDRAVVARIFQKCDGGAT